MAKEYIDREALEQIMSRHKIKGNCLFCRKYETCIAKGLNRSGSHLYCWEEIMLPTADAVEIPKSGIGDLSDGYHTFNELYHHRAVLFSVICNSNPDKAWKSKLHDTGDMYDGMFIVGIETPQGQATYHYDINPYWDMFKVKELEKAPKWDGHTSADAIERISQLSSETEHAHWVYENEADEDGNFQAHCSVCGAGDVHASHRKNRVPHCWLCGSIMDGKDNAEDEVD